MATITQTTTMPKPPVLHLRLKPPKPGAVETVVDLARRIETIAQGTDLGEQAASWRKEQEKRKPEESILVGTTVLLMDIVAPAAQRDGQFMESAVKLKSVLEEELPSGVTMDTWITQFTMQQVSLQSKLRMGAAARQAQSDGYRRQYAYLSQVMETRYNGLLDKALQCEEARVRDEEEWQAKLGEIIGEANGLFSEWNDMQPIVATLNEDRLQGQQELRDLSNKAERLL